MTTGPDPRSAPPRPDRRGLRLALIASLAVNLLFIGLIAGGVVTGSQRPSGPSVGPDMRALWRALPDEQRQALRAEFRDGNGERQDRDTRRAELAAREAEMLAMLRAEDFDAAGFAALLAERREMTAARAETAQAAFVAQISTLPAAERAAIADRYETRRGRRGSNR